MKKSKYKNQNKNNIKIIIIFCTVIFVLLILSMILNSVTKNIDKELMNISGTFDNVEDVLKYYECIYIRESKSSENGYDTDITLVFKHPLYTNDESNEQFYNKVINAIARVLNYRNFRMIDTKNDVNIEVICENNKIVKMIINGIEDYFIYMDSQIDFKKYKEIADVIINANAIELMDLINNSWSGDTYFGTRESIFESYYIYFDEGIEVRRIDSKIYNIVFTKKYENQVVEGVTVGTDIDLIRRAIGSPSFESADKSIIGYKSKDFYVFFSKDQISVYRRDKNDYDKFFELVDEFLNDEKDLLEFMNDLTYLWPDYSEYNYDSTYFFITYPLKGLDIRLNYENMSGIIFYNNFEVSQNIIGDYLEHPEFISRLKLDNIFEAELKRYERKSNRIEMCKNFVSEEEIQENPGSSNKFKYYIDLDENGFVISAYFISLDGEYPNNELSENIYTYAWLGDDYFIYSIKNKGIYSYNVTNRTKGSILQGGDDFEITSIENGVINYDNKALQMNFN